MSLSKTATIREAIMRTTTTLAVIGFSIGFLIPACSSSGPESGDPVPPGTGGNTGDSAVHNDSGGDASGDGDTGPLGPWDCSVPGQARWIATDVDLVRYCGFFGCSSERGCKIRCDSDDDCISSTLQLGWEHDLRVFCDDHSCEREMTWGDDD